VHETLEMIAFIEAALEAAKTGERVEVAHP